MTQTSVNRDTQQTKGIVLPFVIALLAQACFSAHWFICLALSLNAAVFTVRLSSNLNREMPGRLETREMTLFRRLSFEMQLCQMEQMITGIAQIRDG